MIFDPSNPRLPSTKSGVADAEVYRYMLDDGKVLDLMLSISTQGFFQGEPLLVTKSNQFAEKYEVLEGNRRLAALKLLNNPSLAPIKKETVQQIVTSSDKIPDRAPVIIYESRNEVLKYLGYRHITGVQPWDPLAKARYLNQLKEQYSTLPYEEILRVLAKIIGSRADYVHRLLGGYKVYEHIEVNNFFNIPGLNEETFEFSLLTTALAYTKIGEYVGLSQENEEEVDKDLKIEHLKDLSEWIFKETEGKTRLGESRNLKTLNAVVGVDRALKVFKEGRSLDDAEFLTDEPSKTFSNSIIQALKRLTDAKEQSQLVPEPKELDLNNTKEINIISRELHAIIKEKIDNKILGDEL